MLKPNTVPQRAWDAGHVDYGASDPAEVLFERYLRRAGYDFDYEPDLGNGKRPDYLVRADRCEIVCEVKSFDGPGVHQGSKIGTRSQKRVLAPIRKKITEASEQLKGIPNRALVIVLANPRGCPVPLDPFSVMAAMYGDVTGEFRVDAEGVSADITWAAGRNRKLYVADPESGEQIGGNHDYVSAVAVLRREDLAFHKWVRRWKGRKRDSFAEATEEAAAFLQDASGEGVPHSNDVFVDIYETLSDHTLPLPRGVFKGPHDRRWVPGETRDALVRWR